MLRELSIQIRWATIFYSLYLLFVQNVSELFADQILLLLVKDIDFGLSVIKPGMVKDFFGAQSFAYILFEHVLHEVSCQFRGGVFVFDFLLVKLVGQVSDLVRLERDIAVEDCKEAYSC